MKKNYSNKKIVSTIKDLQPGDQFNGIVKIIGKAKPGPVVFMVTDGDAGIEAVTKESGFNVDEVVELVGDVNEHQGKKQIEIRYMNRSDKNFDEILDEKSKPKRTTFSISSERFEILKPYFLKIAQYIRKAILNYQPILIRHHADADGIISGLAIEQSCRALMDSLGINPDYNLYRSPSRAPFYEPSDALRDVILTKRLTENFESKNPIILVLDNGSTPEDIFGLQLIKHYGYESIVVDHHNPVIISNKKSAVCPYVVLHMNPYLEGLNSETCAGMLCYELARMIWEEYDNPMYPAVAGISDRCKIVETDRYIEKSKEDRETLAKIGIAIDYFAYHLKFDSGKGIFEELFINPALVALINDKVNKGIETQLQSTLPYLRTQEINGIFFSTIDLEKYTLRFTYPSPGKVINLIQDKVALGKEHAPVISLGCLSDMIIIRATKPVLPVQTIIKRLRKDIPEANVDGGGHECAGTIKFVAAHSDKILETIKGYVKEIDLSVSENGN